MSATTLPTKTIPIQTLTRVLKPIDQANGLANDFYTESTYFRYERDSVLGQGWVCIGYASDVTKNGYVKPVDFMGMPLLLMRNNDGILQVFHNVCSHRGMKLVQEEGETKGAIICPYHSWTYDLKGNLKGTPHIGGVNQHKDPRVACEKHGLKALRSHIWMDMVFINMSGTAPEFDDALAPLTDRWQQFLGTDGLGLMRPAKSDGTLNIEVNCNWKLAVE